MKTKIFLMLLSLFTVLPMTACIHNDDAHFTLENTKTLINYMENNDKESIKNMFAPNIIEQVDTLDEQIEDLCEYWQGNFVSLSAGGVGGTGLREYGTIIDIVYSSYEIKTTENNYLIATYWYRRDNTDENNVGIWYLWVDSYADDEEPINKGKWENYDTGITLM